MARVHWVGSERVVRLSTGWELCSTGPGEAASPGEVRGPWLPAKVPGTVAQSLRDAGQWSLEQPAPLHGKDFWYRLKVSAVAGPQRLRLHGLATLAEVWLNGARLAQTENMFLAHELEVNFTGQDELWLAFRALHPAAAAKKGRARWRPRMIDPATLRFFRTTLLGNLPGWCPPVHAVGPWRPIERVEQAGPLRVVRADLRTLLDGADGVLALELEVEWTGPAAPEAFVEVSGQRAPLKWSNSRTLRGDLRLERVEPWWPHTHGKPALHPVRAVVGEVELSLGKVGFRSIEVDDANGGFALKVNGERVFCRGACWSTADVVSLPGTAEAYAPWLEQAREAGMNMVRVGGTMAYEADDFYARCDELGLLVWQDFMFANFDYPIADAAFAQSVQREAEQLLSRLQGSPSLAVLCGGSEVLQQASMLGLPRASWSSPLFEKLLPETALRLRPDVPYVPNSPSGEPLPFLADRGVTHYYGVGAYLRPLDDARRANVRFASECLAFANVPEAVTAAKVPASQWKARIPRDVGAPWDFEDVREHYLQRVYGVEPLKLRYEEPDRYWRLSRAVTGEVMEEVFAEWRRTRSSCAGGLVWTFQDLWPGAGWGVVDSLGVPKAAWHALKRAFRPVQVTLTDEGVNGLAVHLLNETGSPVEAKLTVACLRDGQTPVVQAERALTLSPRAALELSAAELLEAFFDTTYAYRFGPAAHDVTVAALHDARTGARLADAFHFPLGRGTARFELGLTAKAERTERGWALRLATKRLAQSVQIDDEHFRAADEWFHLAPGVERVVPLLPRGEGAAAPDGEVQALNALAPVRFRGTP